MHEENDEGDDNGEDNDVIDEDTSGDSNGDLTDSEDANEGQNGLVAVQTTDVYYCD